MKIFRIIQRMNGKMRQNALEFLNSPYHNKDTEILKLFEILVRKESTEELTKEEKFVIWNLLYPQKSFDDQKFRKKAHALTLSLERFFTIEQTLESKHQYLANLAGFCENHGILELQNSINKRIKGELNSDRLNEADAYIYSYKAIRHLLNLGTDTERKRSQVMEILTNELPQLDNLLDEFYVIEKIRLFLLQNNFNQISGNQVGSINKSSVQKEIEKIKFIDNQSLTKFTFELFNLLTNPDHDYDIDEIIQNLSLISKVNRNEALQLYDYIHNHLTRRMNQGHNTNYDRLKLLRFGLKSGILLKGGMLDPIDFRNIVHSACIQSEFNWALEFVEDYKSLLSNRYRQSAYSFNKARIFMNMERFDDVVDCLRNVEYEDITYNLNSKLMLMAAFYELDEYDVLESTIKAFKVFLRRRRNISKSRKANFNDHCDVIYQIIKASERRDPKRLTKAKSILENNSGIPNKGWLYERISEVQASLGVKEEESVDS